MESRMAICFALSPCAAHRMTSISRDVRASGERSRGGGDTRRAVRACVSAPETIVSPLATVLMARQVYSGSAEARRYPAVPIRRARRQLWALWSVVTTTSGRWVAILPAASSGLAASSSTEKAPSPSRRRRRAHRTSGNRLTKIRRIFRASSGACETGFFRVVWVSVFISTCELLGGSVPSSSRVISPEFRWGAGSTPAVRRVRGTLVAASSGDSVVVVRDSEVLDSGILLVPQWKYRESPAHSQAPGPWAPHSPRSLSPNPCLPENGSDPGFQQAGRRSIIGALYWTRGFQCPRRRRSE